MPKRLRACFWNVDFRGLDSERDVDVILASVLEFGILEDVVWAMRKYGLDRIHRFFRDVGSPELSERTIQFWCAFFKAEGEQWPRPAQWRRHSPVPWVE